MHAWCDGDAAVDDVFQIKCTHIIVSKLQIYKTERNGMNCIVYSQKYATTYYTYAVFSITAHILFPKCYVCESCCLAQSQQRIFFARWRCSAEQTLLSQNINMIP